MSRSQRRFDDYEELDYAPKRERRGDRPRRPSWESEVLLSAAESPERPEKGPSEPRRAFPGEFPHPAPKQSHTAPPCASPRPSSFVPGPNTRPIRGIPIDFDRLSGISPTSGPSPKDGSPSYGILFSFKGRKGLSRTVWIGRSQAARDSLMGELTLFWRECESKLPE